MPICARDELGLRRKKASCVTNSHLGGDSRLLVATALMLSLMALFGASQSAHAQSYIFRGMAALVPSNNPSNIFPDYILNQEGSFTDPTVWDNQSEAYYPPNGTYSSNAPGLTAGVSIEGFPANYHPPQQGVRTNGVLEGFTGNGCQVTNVTGTIGYLSVFGPGTLGLGDLTVTSTSATTIEAVGAIPYYDNVGNFLGYDPSAETISGGSLSTPLLTLLAGTDLHPIGLPFYADPVADAGSLTITGATVSGATTQIFGDQGGGAWLVSGNPTDPYVVEPISLTNGATLNASTELDLVGVDPTIFTEATGETTLAASGSKITAGSVVIATGATGYGSGSAGSPALVTLTNGSTLTATGSIFVGDTGDGTLTASGNSTISDEQGFLGNAAGSTGTATIDGSTWNNAGYLAVGNFGVGMLTVTNGGQIMNTGPNGNGFISGLMGSSGSQATITGQGSLWQTSGYFEVAGFGEGTLTVADQAQVITGDIMYVGEGTGSTGTLAISGGATVTTNTTGTYGTSAIVLGLVADSTGILTIDGADSQLESKGDMSVGYGGIGMATVTGGGSLIVDTAHFRVGRNEGSTGTLTVTGDQSSVTANNGTIYVGFGGTGTVYVENAATLSVQATDIGSETTGMGTLNVDGMGSQADLGDTTVGDAGNGTLNVSGSATVNTGDLVVGSQENSTGNLVVSDADANVAVDGDFTVGEDGAATVALSGNTSLTADSMTVGSGATSVGTLTLDTGSNVTTSDDATVGDEEGAQGTVTIGLNAAAQLTVGGDMTVGGGGMGTVVANPGSTLTIQGGTFTIGDEQTGNGLVTLNGATWSFGGDLTIGDAGTGKLLMQAGAKNALGGISFLTPSVKLGNQSGSKGTLSLDGNGTSLQVSDLTVGELGKGTLMLSNKAVLTSNGDVTVADQISGVISSVSVATSSMLAINGNLTVGSGGIATMEVMTGGKATAIGTLSFGDNPNGSGIVTVDGASSSLGYGQTLTVGHYGMGTLNITGGALVAPTPGGLGEVDIAAESGSTGAVTISGSDPKSKVSSQLDAKVLAVGGTMTAAGGTGMLTIGTSGQLSVSGTIVVYAGSSLNVTGGTIDPPVLDLLGSYTQTGGSASFGQITGDGSVNVSSGELSLSQGTAPGAFTVGSLSLNGGTFDIGGNALMVNYGSSADPAATIRGYFVSGFNANGTKWQGTGIISSLAAADPSAFSVGYADGGNPMDRANTGVSSGEVEVEYTVAGDANLSGGVDLADLVIIASDFGATGADWAAGDVNYDGNVDLSDLVIVASNFGASLSSVQAAGFSSSFAAEWKLAQAEIQGVDVNVPEPGAMALGVVGAIGLLGRNRKRWGK